MAWYVSRVPRYVEEGTKLIEKKAKNGEWQDLCENKGFRYLLFKKGDYIPPAIYQLKPILAKKRYVLYDLQEKWQCKRWKDVLDNQK